MPPHESDPEVLFDTKIGRPYTATGGRTRSSAKLNLLTLVCSTRRFHPQRLPPSLDSEHGEVLLLCVAPLSVSEVSAHMHLPAMVVRVLVSDLITIGAVQAKSPEVYDADNEETTKEVLEALLAGLQRRL